MSIHWDTNATSGTTADVMVTCACETCAAPTLDEIRSAWRSATPAKIKRRMPWSMRARRMWRAFRGQS